MSDREILKFLLGLVKNEDIIHLPDEITREEMIERLTDMLDQVSDDL